MTFISGLLIYFLLWWLVLFMVLPWGNSPSDTPEVGFATSAPKNPRLWLKFFITTLVASAAWGGVYWLMTLDWVKGLIF